MTHAEKLAFRVGLPRLGLNASGAGDGPYGLAAGGGRGGAPNPTAQNTTTFPDELAVASTFDRELARQLGQAIGEEFSGKGMSEILGPTVNLTRTWHWGRAAESFGEDPYLMTELSTPEIAALQAQHVVVVLKHYAVYDQETDRQVLNETVGEKALNEIYLPSFRSAVEKAHVGGIFCAFASINGGPAVCSSGEQLGLLRKWGFDGFVRPEAAPDAALAAKAGSDEIQAAALDAAIQSGKLTESDLDLIVYRHLVPMFRLGVFDIPKGAPEANVSTDEHKKIGLALAEEGAVLLKNKGGVLPLSGVKSIAVIGDDAGAEASVQATNSVVPVAGKLSVPSEAIAARAGAGVKVVYEKGIAGDRSAARGSGECVAADWHVLQGSGVDGRSSGYADGCDDRFHGASGCGIDACGTTACCCRCWRRTRARWCASHSVVGTLGGIADADGDGNVSVQRECVGNGAIVYCR